MQLGLKTLFNYLDNCDSGSLVLATVIETSGASYRKAGAMMLIDQQKQSSGLVSGGCLEDDLIAHAQSVFLDGQSKIVCYDLSQEESASLWGLGLGCGGEIHVFLEAANAANKYAGLVDIKLHWQNGQPCTFKKIIKHNDINKIGEYTVHLATRPNGHGVTNVTTYHEPRAKLTTLGSQATLDIPVSPAHQLLICGAGPDAIPLAQIAASQFWSVTIVDHRPGYVNRKIFPMAEQLLCHEPNALSESQLEGLDAAVIMTHNVNRDCEYLRLFASTEIPYIGLLGPVARRDLILKRAKVAPDSRIHGPAGLDLGAVLPEEIALSIMAQLQAVVRHRDAKFLSLLR